MVIISCFERKSKELIYKATGDLVGRLFEILRYALLFADSFFSHQEQHVDIFPNSRPMVNQPFTQ